MKTQFMKIFGTSKIQKAAQAYKNYKNSKKLDRIDEKLFEIINK